MRLQNASAQEVEDYTTLHGFDEFLAHYRQGNGVILAAAHVGNYELTGVRMAQEVPFAVTSLPTLSPRVQSAMAQIRQSRGIEVFHPHRQGRPLLQRLRAGGAVALFADFSGRNAAESLPFFGYQRRILTAPFRMALLTGAPVVPSYAVRRAPWLSDGGFDVHLRPALPSPTTLGQGNSRERSLALAEPFIAQLEALLRQHPDQWLTMFWSAMPQS